MPHPRHLCECELPGDFYTGVPGIVAMNRNGRVAADSVVERCDQCQRYPSDLAALGKLREIGLVAGDSAPGNEQSFTVHCYAVVCIEFPGVVAADRESAVRRVWDRFDWDVHGVDAQIVEEAELAVFVDDDVCVHRPTTAIGRHAPGDGIMNATYECDRCGACCRTKLVDLYELDLWREPTLRQPMRSLREPGLDGEIGYLNCLTEAGCPFLDAQNECSIYRSRPSVCVMFPAGSDECQQARQSLGLPLLEPTINDKHNRLVDRGSSVSITSVRKEDKTMANTEAKARPVHEIRLGRIRAAIWENETQNGTRHNVTLSRLYKDGDQWKDSASFGRDDLPLIGKVVDRCHSWIFEQAAVAAASSGGNGNDNDNGANGDIPF